MEPAPSPTPEPQTTSQEAQLPWLVVYTKPRQEKKLAERLQQAGYTVYYPTHRMKKRWSDRWKWIEQPLFTSHIFIQIDPERRDAVYFVPGFVRFLFWLKRPAQVRLIEVQDGDHGLRWPPRRARRARQAAIDQLVAWQDHAPRGSKWRRRKRKSR
mgnify:CR=1 FL=1